MMPGDRLAAENIGLDRQCVTIYHMYDYAYVS
jgi:hypothetical protein